MRNPTTTTSKTTPCCTKTGLKRGPWTPEEDELLVKYIKEVGEGRWRTLPKKAGLLRCGKSCRLRWMNYLRPNVKRGRIQPDEEDLILRLHRLLGNRWSLIAGRIPGRTDNEIKNYWNTHLSKKLISQGIDPRTHKPLANSSNMNGTEASSSSKVIPRIPNPKPNSSLEETDNVTTTKPTVPTTYFNHSYNELAFNNNNNVNNLEKHCHQNGTNNYTNLMNYNTSKNNELEGFNDIEDETMDNNYCNDDIFSSFLNSLINEDPCPSQHLMQQQEQPNIYMAPSSIHMVPIANSFAFEDGINGKSTIMSSPMYSQNDIEKVNEQLG